MAAEISLVMRLMSASVSIANRAGSIVRDIMKAGDLGVVMKNQVMSASHAIASKAGMIIRDIMKAGDLGVVLKNQREDDPQTEADRKAQRCIVSSLQTRFPGITVIGEEDLTESVTDLIELGDSEDVLHRPCPDALKSVSLADIVVWVDPVDGTKEYTQGFLDHVTVLIGVAVNGESVGGVIHQPYYNYQVADAKMGRTMWGVVGLGCFGFTHKELPESQRVITTTRSHGTEAVQETIDAMCPTEILRVGGAGHKVLLCLEGTASAYIFASPGCKKWDTCAPEALLKAAGGLLTDVHGNRYRYEKDIKRMNTGASSPHIELTTFTSPKYHSQ